jgi:hypothetical protein
MIGLFLGMLSRSVKTLSKHTTCLELLEFNRYDRPELLVYILKDVGIEIEVVTDAPNEFHHASEAVKI